MRLLLLPISTRRALIYCEPIKSITPVSKKSYIDRGVTYATKTWTEWEKAPTGWKMKLTGWGNKMLRRIPYEEWGLKSLPSISRKLKEEYAAGKKVDIRFPGLYQGLGKESVLDFCKRLSKDRQPVHQKRLYGSISLMPFTIPFGLIPVLPNIPFFYLIFRAYSHYRALNGAKHLEHLVKANLINPAASSTLDSMYSSGLLYSTPEESVKATTSTPKQNEQAVSMIRHQMSGRPQGEEKADRTEADLPRRTTSSTHAEEIMLLKGWNGKLIAEKLELPGLQVEIERAVEQVENDLKKVDQARQEKPEVEAAEKQTAK